MASAAKFFFTANCVLFVAVLSAQTPSADRYWPQWRGPDMTGVSKHATPPLEWSETKNVRWKVEIPGRGSATPVVWGDRLFVLTAVPEGLAPRPHMRRSAASRRAGRIATPCSRLTERRARRSGSASRARTRRTKRRVPTTALGRRARPSPTESTSSRHPSPAASTHDMNGTLVWKKSLGLKSMRSQSVKAARPRSSAPPRCRDHQGQSFIAALDKATGAEFRANATRSTRGDAAHHDRGWPHAGRGARDEAHHRLRSRDRRRRLAIRGPDDESNPVAGAARWARDPDERLPGQRESDPARRRERRHHGHTGGRVDLHARHAIRAVACATASSISQDQQRTARRSTPRAARHYQLQRLDAVPEIFARPAPPAASTSSAAMARRWCSSTARRSRSWRQRARRRLRRVAGAGGCHIYLRGYRFLYCLSGIDFAPRRPMFREQRHTQKLRRRVVDAPSPRAPCPQYTTGLIGSPKSRA